MDDCACSEESCKTPASSDPKALPGLTVLDPQILSDERAAPRFWTGPPDSARYDDEDAKEGPEVGLLECEATSTEADYAEMQGLVDSSSDDEDMPDFQRSVVKQKAPREKLR